MGGYQKVGDEGMGEKGEGEYSQQSFDDVTW